MVFHLPHKPGRRRRTSVPVSQAFAPLFAQAQGSARRAVFNARFGNGAEMKPRSIDPDMTVDEIMRRWPATIGVMIAYKMVCIGCPIGVFHTVTDVCEAHGIDEDAFSADLLAAMQRDPIANVPSAFADTQENRPGT